MSKLIQNTIEMLQRLAQLYLPAIHGLIQRGVGVKTLSMSMVAHYSRRLGTRTVWAVGVLATLYATYLLGLSLWVPGAPKASHDVILKTRLSSPAPSPDILIVDIDERTLAALSAQHGRWPWSRDVLADGLQKITDLGARAVLFNVLMSDPDKNHPDADAVMDLTAQMSSQVAFPLIRLNPDNDKLSTLEVAQIPGAQLKPDHAKGTTMAAVLPMFASMQERLGVANQKPDGDGIVRKYPLRWAETTFVLPSVVQRTAELAGAHLADIPDVMPLNWRNKKGRYARVSFSDLYLDQLTPEQTAAFKESLVVLSLSAPGLGQTKPTAVMAVQDDGEILATALDDALKGSYLRTLPSWVAFLINLLTIWTLVWLSTGHRNAGLLNKVFVLAQSGLGSITMLSASYTYYLIDLSDSMSFGLGVFAAIKMVQSMDDRWSRACPGFRKIRHAHASGQLWLLGFLDHQVTSGRAKALQAQLERIVGLPNVVRMDDLFAGESFIKARCSQYKAILVNVDRSRVSAIQELLSQPEYARIDAALFDMQEPWNTENPAFSQEVAPLVLASASRLLGAVDT